MTVVTVSEKPRLHESIQDDQREVADLWRDALKAYKGIVGFDLEKRFDSTQQLIDFGTQEMNNFHKFRHNDKKVDQLRSLFMANIDYIETGAAQLISAATPSFPPAAAIGTAITFMLTACRQVSADYDIVVVFFEDMNSFLQRIVILETRMPQHNAFHNCLMDVFTSFLTMCGYAHKYIELGRFKKWVQNLMFGEDSELSGARKKMDTCLSRLQNATEFAILGNTEQLKRMTKELEDNQRAHTETLQEHTRALASIQDTTENIASDMAKLLEAFKSQKREVNQDRKKLSAEEKDRPPSAKRIRNLLADVQGEILEYHILKETLVPDTCNWIFSQSQWTQWVRYDGPLPCPVLAIAGQPGMGKSHLAVSIFDRCANPSSEATETTTLSAHFYFRQQNPNLSSFLSAVVTIVNQVAEQNDQLCELIISEYLKDEHTLDRYASDDLVDTLLRPCFRADSKYQLYLVFDGVDELDTEEFDKFLAFVTVIKEQQLRINVVVTTRPEQVPQILDSIAVQEIEVTKEKQMQDIKALVWNRLSTLGNLRRFSRYMKQRISDNVEEASPSMLYAENLLVRFDTLAREGAVLRALGKPLPPTLHDLYDTMYETVLRQLTVTHQKLAKTLLYLVAFSIRPILLHEAVAVVEYLTNTPGFDIEEVLQPLSSLIRVGDAGYDAEERARLEARGGSDTAVQDLEKGNRNDRDRIYDDADLTIQFRERSMQSFLRSTHGKDDKYHWSPSEAHRQIYLFTANLCRLEQTTGTEEEKAKANNGSSAKLYSIHNSLIHWRNIVPSEHSAEEVAEVMEAFWAQMADRHSYSRLISSNSVDYEAIFPEEAFDRVDQYSGLALSDEKIKLTEEAGAWWAEVQKNRRDVLKAMVKGHVLDIYNQVDLSAAQKCLNSLAWAIETAEYRDILFANAREKFPEEASSTLDRLSPDAGLTERRTVLGVAGLFGTEMEGDGYRSIAELLVTYKFRAPAEKMCRKALELVQDPPARRFQALALMAHILLKRNRADEADEYVQQYNVPEYLANDDISAGLKRSALITKARIDVRRGLVDFAMQSYIDARNADPGKLLTGDILGEELSLHNDNEDKKPYFDTFKRWSPLEKLTWVAWDYVQAGGYFRALELLDLAIQHGEKEFVIKIYQDAIELLDNVNAGAPLRCDLADIFIQAEDLESARRVIDEVLDSSSTGWPYAVTNTEPEEIATRAINTNSDVLYALFRQSKDPKVKTKIVESAKGMLNRNLLLDVPTGSDTAVVFYCTTVTQMIQKMGPATEFQTWLQDVIDNTVARLQDSVDWNDCNNMMCLAKALYVLAMALPESDLQDELLRASDIFGSARFSRLSVQEEDEEEGDDDQEVNGEDGEGSEEKIENNNEEVVEEDEYQYDDDDDGEDLASESEDEDEEDEGEGEGEEGGEGEGEDGGDAESEPEDVGKIDEDNAVATEANGNDCDPEDDDEEGGEGDEEDSDSEPDEGDLMGEDRLGCACAGVCEDTVFWKWGNDIGYQCYTCDAILCEDCYEKRIASERLSGRQYCGHDHLFWKLPMEGWRGVKNGKIRLEGEEDIVFTEFLEKVHKDLCKRAWDAFWDGA